MSDRLTDEQVAVWAAGPPATVPPPEGLDYAVVQVMALAREVQSERAWRKRIADSDFALVEAIFAELHVWSKESGARDLSKRSVASVLRALATVQKEQNDGG